MSIWGMTVRVEGDNHHQGRLRRPDTKESST
jgi:hypothetical protein